MSDTFANYSPTPSGPYRRAVVVSPHNDNDLAEVTNALFNGDATNKSIAVILADDATSVTLANVAPGVVLPIRVRRVLATGTTSTNVVALY